MVNQMLDGEMDYFLEEESNSKRKNKQNGKTKKTVISTVGKLKIETPRDRKRDFEPQLIEKRQRELSSGLDNEILALYAQGNSIEDIRRLLIKLYGVTISSRKISMITDRILDEIEVFRTRQLLAFYTIVFLDAIHFKVRHEGKYEMRTFYTVYGTDSEGRRDLLGLYISESEGANR